AEMTGADFSRAKIGLNGISAALSRVFLGKERGDYRTIFANVDLSEVLGLDSVLHIGSFVTSRRQRPISHDLNPYKYLISRRLLPIPDKKWNIRFCGQKRRGSPSCKGL